MRKISKGPEPAVLVTHGDAWTQEYAESIATGASPLPSRWRHPEIVDALEVETYSKCAYCEGIIADVSYPHVEHIAPKSKRPDLVLEWTNLTLACPVCNVNKLDYYDPAAPLLDPLNDDPSESLTFRGPAVWAKLGDAAGARTITRLKLMRTPLLLERLKRLEALHALLDAWDAADGADKQFRAQMVSDAIAEDQEFSAFLEAEAQANGFAP